MIKIKSSKEKKHTLAVSSPEDLVVKLKTFQENSDWESRNLYIAIRDRSTLTCWFSHEKESSKKLHNKILMDAVELLNLPAEGIAVDYQIFEETDRYVKGIFLCMPQKTLNIYLNILQRKKISAFKISTLFLTTANRILNDIGKKGKICILECSKENVIDLGIFDEGRCEAIREIFFDSEDEAIEEIKRTIRSAFTRSKNKNVERIIFIKSEKHVSGCEKALEKTFHAKIDFVENLSQEDLQKECKSFFNLNLMAQLSLPDSLRKHIMVSLQMAVLFLAVVSVLLAWNIYRNRGSINSLKSQLTLSEEGKG